MLLSFLHFRDPYVILARPYLFLLFGQLIKSDLLVLDQLALNSQLLVWNNFSEGQLRFANFVTISLRLLQNLGVAGDLVFLVEHLRGECSL